MAGDAPPDERPDSIPPRLMAQEGAQSDEPFRSMIQQGLKKFFRDLYSYFAPCHALEEIIQLHVATTMLEGDRARDLLQALGTPMPEAAKVVLDAIRDVTVATEKRVQKTGKGGEVRLSLVTMAHQIPVPLGHHRQGDPRADAAATPSHVLVSQCMSRAELADLRAFARKRFGSEIAAKINAGHQRSDRYDPPIVVSTVSIYQLYSVDEPFQALKDEAEINKYFGKHHFRSQVTLTFVVVPSAQGAGKKAGFAAVISESVEFRFDGRALRRCASENK
jgi:hypothetical protein